ncbi:LysR family transcriptional regulator [Paraburkholderia hospita]|uniref:LysR family transcriptional regulator n=1 Tax=Paraburkholderia hospita TaxID=169430 RepID=A0ABP2PFS4_9BURK|nr:LysR substrate-binding domain-containing protein [Paraburkholderia hospita]EIM96384.1 LysR family transcriptional regulator [Paraburkholderia hospita]OUL70152.1 LysR family transcriptional regulator [Paraburkholderia hospita]
MKRFSRLPPLQCLVAFEAVSRLGSGSLAATELSVTPSAISHRIKQLEESLGVSLFKRRSNELTVTSVGLKYLEVVRDSLDALSRYPRDVAKPDDHIQIRISSPPTFARQVIVPRLRSFQRSHPDVEVVLQLSVPFVGLKADNADLEIRFGSGNYPGLEVAELANEPIFPACSPAYAHKYGPFHTPADLVKASLLRCPIEPWRPWFKAASIDLPEPNSGSQFVDIGLMVEAALHGQGIALAREFMTHSWLECGLLVRLFDLPARGQHAYYAAWSASSPQYTHIEAFVSWLQAELRESGPARVDA